MLLSLALAAAALAVQSDEAAPPVAPLPELLDHAALEARLAGIAAAHPELATTLRVGRSRGGRAITALRLAAGEVAPGRPALLVVANVDGAHVWSSGLALWQVERLIERAEADARVRELLASTTLYVLPRAAPDAAEARFATPLDEVVATGSANDADRDGRVGEDGPSDVDGDGVVTWMRVPDPEGGWTADPTDARASVRADAARGQLATFDLVREGRDLDGDEQASEDPAHHGRVDENFAALWREHTPSAGLFPMEDPEARALADFVIERTDVAAVVTYGRLDNLVNAPESVDVGAPAVKRVPRAGWLKPDAERLAELARRRKAAGRASSAGEGGFEGSFPLWAYDHRGLWSVAVRPWDIPLDAKEPEDKPDESEAAAPTEGAETVAGDKDKDKDKRDKAEEPKPGDEAKRLIWCEAEGELARFHAWTPFEHPELGALEIGGWKPYARTEPPAAAAGELAEAELAFLLELAAALPRVRVAESLVRELGAGLFEVRCTLQNDSLLPLRSASAERTQTQRGVRVRLVLPEGGAIVAGRVEERVDELAGAGGRHELRWLAKGPFAGAALEVASDHAGTARVALEVTR
jgi:hypothetical protein